MNNKRIIFISFLFFALFCGACKNKAVEYYEFKITNDSIQPKSNGVEVSGAYSYGDEVNGVDFSYGLDKELVDAISKPMELEGFEFSVSIDSLTPNTMYYYCYRVDFGINKYYRTEIDSFRTLHGLPLVKTVEVDSINVVSCYVSCEVVSDGGTGLSERGILWNTNGEPGVNDNKVKHAENGVGEYSCMMENLEPNTKYFVRAYAKNDQGYGLGEVLAFQTGNNSPNLPAVTTIAVFDITSTTVTCSGKVDNSGGSLVSSRGVCWSTEHNPTIDDDYASVGSGEGEFSVTIDGLSPNTRYYFRAYATNTSGTSYGEEKSFVTLPLTNSYYITVESNNDDWGSANGGGLYDAGATCTLKAIANEGCDFVNWSEDGSSASINAVYSFIVEGDRHLVANFAIHASLPTVLTVSVTDINANSANCVGNVTNDGGAEVTQRGICWGISEDPTIEGEHDEDGAGTGLFEIQITGLEPNTIYYARAYAINSAGINYGENQRFQTTTPAPPVGAINGQFSVGEGTVVYFSKGNLQYIGSAGNGDANNTGAYWKFADNQLDVLGNNGQGSVIQTVDRDLFGWGTSGYNHNNACYQPWATEQTNNRYYAYGDSGQNLYDEDGRADWGYNAIQNGGNTENRGWRTLTKKEWNHVFNKRESNNIIDGISNARYAKATVNGKAGVILFPDNFIEPDGVDIPANIINKSSIAFTHSFRPDEWNLLENNGCVFLPVSGSRSGTSYNNEDKGYYWSSSSGNDTSSFGLAFDSNTVSPSYASNRSTGISVRLVYPVEQ